MARRRRPRWFLVTREPWAAQHGRRTWWRWDDVARRWALPTGSVRCRGGADTVAYLMYTSGLDPAGQKGVAVTHRNIVRLVRKTTGYGRVPAPATGSRRASNVSFDARHLRAVGGAAQTVPNWWGLDRDDVPGRHAPRGDALPGTCGSTCCS